jgi:hypothetical protein
MQTRCALFGVVAILLLVLLVFFPAIGYCADEKTWYVSDVIDPSLDQVKWNEQGGISEPVSWIADGSWTYASLRESLVGQSDIFVSTYEQFNWSKVRSNAEYYYGKTFSNFNAFATTLQDNPGPWLDLSWQMDVEWYGVSSNTTKVDVSFDESTSTAELSSWFHITRVPEYLAGQKALDNWLTGFDLTSVSTGSLTLWEVYQDWSTTGIYYNLRFEAPSGMLTQHGDNYTCIIAVAPNYKGNSFKISQNVEINMPSDTTIKEALPVSMSVLNENEPNTASFVISRGDLYPESYTVVSGSPAKSFGQVFLEALGVWFLTPGGWAAIASLLVLSITGLRGRRIWRRNRLYHRVYKSMVTLYDLYAKEDQRFHLEMDNTGKSIFKMMVEDKITDEQFEKLLKRRDDLLERADKQRPPPPPTRV